jgi:glycosyltransferase involved in cell wall biosynthesis
VNGLLVALLGRLLNINTIYICGGGPREVLGGGYSTESRIFNKIQRPDKFLEARLIQATKNFDLIVTMGKDAAEFFKSKGIKNQIEIIPGGFDDSVYTPIGESQTKEYDLILVGRLSEIKRVDRFLEAIQICAKKGICYRAAIVGGGPDKTELVTYAETLEINTHVTFVGWSDDVSSWLQRSRVFVLTSDSEGLSQALIQAMMCGLPAVVSDVGDLGDLVDRHNGRLVNPLTAQNFAYCFQQILDTSYEKFASNALESSKLYRTSEVILQWDRILRNRL